MGIILIKILKKYPKYQRELTGKMEYIQGNNCYMRKQ